MPRFFVDESQIVNDKIILDKENSNHLSKVLRSKIGDKIDICNKKETDFECEIVEISKNEVVLKILNEYKNKTEPNIKVTLFQALPKASKMELIIEKCVEIGVSEITPIETIFCTAKKNDKAENKIARWQKISESASKQCNRGIIPKINNVMNIKDIKDEVDKFDIFLVAYEKEKDVKIKDYLKDIENKNINNIGIMIGSEGGFSEEEIDYLKELNIESISLTNRILRTETASLFLLTILMYQLEG